MNKLSSFYVCCYITTIFFNGSIVGQMVNRSNPDKILGGSAAVVFRNTNEIVVAADCKAIYLDKQNAGELCKIHFFPSQNIGFVAAGAIINKGIGYNLNNFAKEICLSSSYIAEKGSLFVKEILPSFIDNLNSMRKFKGFINFNIREQSAEVCFFGFEKNIAVISHVKIIPNSSYFDTGKYEVQIKNTDSTNINDSKVYFLGASDQMYEALASGKIKLPYTKAANQLIEIAINNNSETVGYPISILSIKKDFFEWFLDGCCK